MTTGVLQGAQEYYREALTVNVGQGLKRLVDCRICGAPNGEDREGCYNCGSLLNLRQDVSEMRRLAVGDAQMPGRVLYVLR